MILKTHDLETLYSSYKIYINDGININFSHFIILQLDSIWRAASGALDAWLDGMNRRMCRQPPGRRRGSMHGPEYMYSY